MSKGTFQDKMAYLWFAGFLVIWIGFMLTSNIIILFGYGLMVVSTFTVLVHAIIRGKSVTGVKA